MQIEDLALSPCSTGRIHILEQTMILNQIIKRIRTQVEQGILGALTRFHQCRIEKQIGFKASKTIASSCGHESGPRHCQQAVLELAENTHDKVTKLNRLLLDVKDVIQQTCLLTELHNINEGQQVNNKKSC